MLSNYHPGVFGNGEWTCCKAKAKDETGCRETTQEKHLPANRRYTMNSLSELQEQTYQLQYKGENLINQSVHGSEHVHAVSI